MMEPEELRALLKKVLIIGAFFLLAGVFYLLEWRAMLLVYVIIVGILSVLGILLQSGRGGGLAASLGGMGAESLLGAHSATPIAKATYVMLALFIFICMLTARLGVSEEGEAEFVPPPPARESLPAGLPEGLEAPPAPAPEAETIAPEGPAAE